MYDDSLLIHGDNNRIIKREFNAQAAFMMSAFCFTLHLDGIKSSNLPRSRLDQTRLFAPSYSRSRSSVSSRNQCWRPCCPFDRTSHDRASASSLALLRAALVSSAFFCFSACFRSITSTARFMPCFSNALFLWQNSYIRKEPNTNEPTAQLQEDQTVAE